MDPSVKSGIRKFTNRLKCIKTSNQFSDFLHAFGNFKRRSGRKIKCQPTSIARRQERKPRGCGPLGVGRPRNRKEGEKLIHKRAKRSRNLARNISLNQPNAKSYGNSH